MSGYEFKKVEAVGSDELIGAGALMASVRKRLAAVGIDEDPKTSFATSAGYEPKVHLIVHAPLGNGLILPLLAHPWAYDKKAMERAATNLCQRWQEALARREALAEAVDRARVRIEAALGWNGGTSRLLTIGLGTQDIGYGINMRQVAIVAEIERLDYHLEPEVVRLDYEIAKDIVEDVVAERSTQKERASRRARLVAGGGRFEIEAVAKAAIEAAGRTVEDVACELLKGETSVVLSRPCETSSEKMVASVCEGRIVVVGRLRADDRTFHILDRFIVAEPAFPASEVTSMAGRPFQALHDHPVMRAAGRIGAVEDESGTRGQTTFRLRSIGRSVVRSSAVSPAA